MENQREIVRVGKLADDDQDEYLKATTAAQRLEMIWELTVDAWAFKGESVDQLPLPRHIVRVLRGKA